MRALAKTLELNSLPHQAALRLVIERAFWVGVLAAGRYLSQDRHGLREAVEGTGRAGGCTKILLYKAAGDEIIALYERHVRLPTEAEAE